jgi:rod shape-determining protein MreC
MPALRKSRANGALLISLLFGQLLLMSGSVRHSQETSILRDWVSRVTAPVVSLAGAIGGGASGVVDQARELLAAHARNRELESEIGRLRREMRLARVATDENARLRNLLEMRENLIPRSIGASVVTSQLTGQDMVIVVDRGRDDGVRVDLPVVSWGGAVGRIVEVGPGHALVRLLTDANSGVAGVVQGSRAQGMVVGQGGDVLDLLYVPRFSAVTHGDRVVTSGLEGIFPRGFGIGTVIDIQEKPDGSQTIRLRPELDYRTMEEVLILLEPVGGEMLSPSGVEIPR